jgi:hypothetical protein
MKAKLAVAMIPLLITCSVLARPGTTKPATRPAERTTIRELIDTLTQVSNKEFALRTNIIAVGADGSGPLPTGLLMRDDPSPTATQAMKELVRRGAAAVPELIAHLGDARKTKATIEGMFPGITYSAEYDWNHRARKNPPSGVVDNAFLDDRVEIQGRPEGNQYTLSVGDLCFELLGEIVNRDFAPVCYRPTAIVIVNSPVLHKPLRDAAVKDWGQLTPQGHRESLIADVVTPGRPQRDESGIRLLAAYYPDTAEEAALRRLRAPLYDSHAIRTFAQERLYRTEDKEARKQLVEEFVKRRGPAFRDGLLLQLWADDDLTVGDNNRIRVEPRQILADLQSDIDPNRGPIVNATDYLHMTRFIQALSVLRSEKIRQALWETFQTYSKSDEPDWHNEDWIAETCIARLAGGIHDAQFLAYCKRRRHEVLASHWKHIDALMTLPSTR